MTTTSRRRHAEFEDAYWGLRHALAATRAALVRQGVQLAERAGDEDGRWVTINGRPVFIRDRKGGGPARPASALKGSAASATGPPPAPRDESELGHDLATKLALHAGMPLEEARKHVDTLEAAIANLQAPRIAASPRPVVPTKAEARGTQPGRTFLGHCYATAAGYVRAQALAGGVQAPIRLVHGTVGRAPHVLAHAWVEVGDKVFDGTQQAFFDRQSYEQELHAVVEQRYTPEEALVRMLRSGHSGPWHETSGSFKARADRKPRGTQPVSLAR